MSIIHDNFVFIHIEKTGGTSLEQMFVDNYPKDRVDIEPKHVALRQLPYQLLYDRFKFTIVRNPYARQYSWFQHHLRSETVQFTTFEDYFWNKARSRRFFQEYYLRDLDLFDKVYQTEKYEELISDLYRRLDLKFYSILNIGEELEFDRDYTKYYTKYMRLCLEDNEPTLLSMFTYRFGD